jgi:hypothetical protein
MKLGTFEKRLLFATVRIEAALEVGEAIGTGFLFQWTVPGRDDGAFVIFLVTNRHVIEGAKRVRFHFTRSSDDGTTPILGERFFVELEEGENYWFKHPDPRIDLALCSYKPIHDDALAQGLVPVSRCIPQYMVPKPEDWTAMNVCERIVFVGYPGGYYDAQNNLPLLRTGTTASLPEADFNGMPIFLIDASVFPGSSGSPVFIVREGGLLEHRHSAVPQKEVYLAGVLAAVHVQSRRGTIEVEEEQTSIKIVPIVNEPIDLGLVYKISCVEELAGLWMQRTKQLYPTPGESSNPDMTEKE